MKKRLIIESIRYFNFQEITFVARVQVTKFGNSSILMFIMPVASHCNDDNFPSYIPYK